jgi:tyrosine aminotransferase
MSKLSELDVAWKVQYEGDTRVFHGSFTTVDELLVALNEFVQSSFFEGSAARTPCMSYVDESGDSITLSTAYDIDHLLKRDGMVKLYVHATPLATLSDKEAWYLPRNTNVPTAVQTKSSRAVVPSRRAMQTRNYIREIVDKLDMTQVPKDKEFISVSIGDPSVYEHLKPAKEVTAAVNRALLSKKNNGYQPSVGTMAARTAVARKFGADVTIRPETTADDVFLTCGCSQAIEMAICSVMNEEDVILLPQPGFPLYRTVCVRHGFETGFYRLLEDDDWEIDLSFLRAQIKKFGGRVKAILVNNPSNPCGSVLSKRNIEQVLEICDANNITILADEIYGEMVFEGQFHSMASLAAGRDVPVLTLGGMAKIYLVPGWRLGWIVVHDTNHRKLTEVKKALFKLSTVILGPASIIQAAVPSILADVPKDYYTRLNRTLSLQSDAFFELFTQCPGLRPVRARGAMYIMVGIDFFEMPGFADDVKFADALLKEEAVLVLPGSIFGMPNFFRVVTCPPLPAIEEIKRRFLRFTRKHSTVGRASKSKL